ncbi:hypothetical protein A9Q96_05220 [Rhodobacterales bacterium 52_120_T64]|nr:hypothetical protein A9Q96_05220 [Rhodobacterales bacterium 52_120_T64]
MQETDLYAPVKTFLESQGYEVKAEVTDCDLVAIRENEPPVIVELKLSLSLDLLMQGIERQKISDAVYVAVPAGKGKTWNVRAKNAIKICKRLGLGLISVRFDSGRGNIIVHTDPGAYKVHKLAKRKTALLLEFQRRVGDPNTGGQSRRAIITAYRQDALRIAIALQAGPSSPSSLAKLLAIPKAQSILQKNYYGWFIRVERGVYSIGPEGSAALKTYNEIVEVLAVRTYK